MKKISLILLLVVASLTKSKAQIDLLWQPYPINVSSYTDAIGERLVFSVYDSALNITQYDTSVYDPSSGFFQWQYNGSGMVVFYVYTYNLYYIVYDHEKHVFAKGTHPPAGFVADGFGQGNWAYIRDDIGGGPEGFELVYYNIVTGLFESVNFYPSDHNFNFNSYWYSKIEYGGAVDDGEAGTFRRGMSGSGLSWNDYGQSPYISFVDNIAITYQDNDLGFNSHVEAANSNFYSGTIGSEGIGVCNPSVISKNAFAFVSSCDSTSIYIDDNWLKQWKGYRFNQLTTVASKRILKDGVAVFVPDTSTSTKVYCAAYNTTTHNWLIDSTSCTGVKNLTVTNGTVTWQDNALTNYQRGYDNNNGWSTGTTPLYLNFYINAFDTIVEGNLIYVRNYSIGTEATTFSFSDGYTTTEKSTSRLFKINGTYYSQPGAIQVCISAAGQTVCNNSVFTRCGNPSATIVATSPNPVCAAGTVTLATYTNFGTGYQWKLNGTNISGATASTYVAAQPGSYSCQVTSGCNATTSLSNTFSVNIGSPSVTITSSSTTICSGSSITLIASQAAGNSYQWKLNGNDISGANNDTYSTSTGGAYTCEVTNICGPILSNSITLVNSALPIANVTPTGTTTICAGNSHNMAVTATAGNTYQWYKASVGLIAGATNSTYSVSPAVGSHTYNCIVTNSLGCTNASNVSNLTVQALPTISITAGGPVVFCTGGSVTLNASSSVSNYQWKGNGINISGATFQNYSALATGNYTCEVTSTCGAATSNSIAVTVSPAPTASISAGGPTTFCSGSSVTLTANSGIAYQWKNNSANISGATLQFYYATTTGNYTCSVSSTCGTALSNSISVSVGSTTASISANGSTNICPNTIVSMTAYPVPGATYQWQLNGANLNGLTAIGYGFITPGDYTCVVSSPSCGSSISNTITISNLPAPLATISPSTSITICAGSVQTFTANTGSNLTYQWRRNGVNIANATNISYTTSNTGSYSVVVSDGGSCTTSSAQIPLSNNPLPTATNTASTPTTVCAGGGVVFNANSGTGLTYQWQKNSVNIPGGTLISYTATTAGSYRVTVSNNFGCTRNSSAITAAFTGSSVTSAITVVGTATFCAGSGTYLQETTSVPGYSYQWQNNGVDITGATLSTYTPAISGTYTVRVTASCGTALSSQQIITVNPLPIATITASGSTSICTGSSVILNAQTGTGYTYQWQLNGSNILNATSSSFSASSAGNYTCNVTNSCGSIVSNAIAVTVGSLPSASITAQGNTALCGAATVQLDANSGTGLSYQWQLNGSNIAGATNQNYVAGAVGSYTCLVTSTCGTATSNAISVTAGTVPAQPDPIIGITQSCNPQNNVIFSIPAVSGATSYNWYSLNPAVTINGPNGGTTVSVNLGTTTTSTWNLKVEPINACGTGTYRSTSIRRTVSGVTTVTGTSVICGVTNGVTYSCNTVGGADDYLWTVPTGATIISGQGTTSITVNYGSAFNDGSVCVASRLNCGFTANPKCFAVTNGGTTPGKVSGNSTVCAGGSGNFSIVAIAGVTYNWTVPAGASITSGAGTNAITVLFPSTFSSGNVCVSVTNSCGVTSASKCRSVINAAPSRPASISGNLSGVCAATESYTSTASANATSYFWSVTGGSIQSGQGTQTVFVLWNNTSSTGTLNVNGVNTCGNGLVRSVAVNLKPSSTASITGNTAACANTNEVYNFTSLYGTTNYLWSVNTSSGATVSAGQGTTSATIHWAANGGTVYCTPSNACGSSSTKTLAVSITCRQAAEFTVDENSSFNLTAIPNPFNNELNITSSVYGDGVVLKLSDMLGRIISTQPLNSENTLLQTSQLKNGIYFVEVINGTEKKTIKVVKAE